MGISQTVVSNDEVINDSDNYRRLNSIRRKRHFQGSTGVRVRNLDREQLFLKELCPINHLYENPFSYRLYRFKNNACKRSCKVRDFIYRIEISRKKNPFKERPSHTSGLFRTFLQRIGYPRSKRSSGSHCLLFSSDGFPLESI